MINSGMMSSNSEEWSTPQDLFDLLNSEFEFTLDPCATAENAKCEKFFTKEQNGLEQSWAEEMVFVNPPYGRKIGDWVKKAFREYYRHQSATSVLLLPARTDTIWISDCFAFASEMRFLKGRLKFGGSETPAPFPSVVVVLDRDRPTASPHCFQWDWKTD